MVIGTCRLVLSLPGNDSLKGKRRVIRRIVDRLRHRFNVAVAEVGDLDAHRSAVLGLAVVSNDARHANSMIDTLVSAVAGASEALVVDRRMEIVDMGEGEHLASHEGPFEGGWSDEDPLE
ncbi:MAG: DUF503 domain-containing protein [Sandaracinaceae bacterium]|nr:DUF503 domain-containing protein [Sandaracinaceae bacterium]